MTQRFRLGAGALVVLLAACATERPREASPVAGISPSFPVRDAIHAEQLPAVLAALQMELTRRLRPEIDSALLKLSVTSDGSMKLILNSDAAFESDSAQMHAGMLVRLSEYAAAARGPYVVHVLGFADAVSGAAESSLAQRRAVSIAAYLISQGLPANRVRVESRPARESSGDAAMRQPVELILEAIVAGREGRAWMPPP